MNKIYKIFACMILPAVVSCSYDPYKHDVPAVEEKLVLTSSVGHIVLNEETLDDVIVTFDWEPARQMPDEYVITYTTELDVVGNNFGSTTVIMNTEDDGVFSRSFTDCIKIQAHGPHVGCADSLHTVLKFKLTVPTWGAQIPYKLY